jgi:hypothetical protein
VGGKFYFLYLVGLFPNYNERSPRDKAYTIGVFGKALSVNNLSFAEIVLREWESKEPPGWHGAHTPIVPVDMIGMERPFDGAARNVPGAEDRLASLRAWVAEHEASFASPTVKEALARFFTEDGLYAMSVLQPAALEAFLLAQKLAQERGIDIYEQKEYPREEPRRRGRRR